MLLHPEHAGKTVNEIGNATLTTSIAEQNKMIYPIPSGVALQIYERGYRYIFNFQPNAAEYVGQSYHGLMKDLVDPAEVPKKAAVVYADDFTGGFETPLGTLRLYRDLQWGGGGRPHGGVAWEVFGFEASPLICPFANDFAAWLNGVGAQPETCLPSIA